MIPPRQVLCLRVAYTIPHPNNVFSLVACLHTLLDHPENRPRAAQTIIQNSTFDDFA